MLRALRALRRPVRCLWSDLVDAVLPRSCPACGDAAPANRGVCHRCAIELLSRPWGGCVRCGAPLTPSGACLEEHRDLRNLAFLAAPFLYAGVGGGLVRRFKLDGDAPAGEFLAAAMAQRLRAHIHLEWRRAKLVPVPLHARKRRRRGFDQAAWLATAIARRLGLEVAPDTLRRVRDTPGQGDPRTTNREANVHEAFALAYPARVANRRVILVDDVATSGATLRECARVLRAAGVPRIGALTACRA